MCFEEIAVLEEESGWRDAAADDAFGESIEVLVVRAELAGGTAEGGDVGRLADVDFVEYIRLRQSAKIKSRLGSFDTLVGSILEKRDETD